MVTSPYLLGLLGLGPALLQVHHGARLLGLLPLLQPLPQRRHLALERLHRPRALGGRLLRRAQGLGMLRLEGAEAVGVGLLAHGQPRLERRDLVQVAHHLLAQLRLRLLRLGGPLQQVLPLLAQRVRLGARLLLLGARLGHLALQLAHLLAQVRQHLRLPRRLLGRPGRSLLI